MTTTKISYVADNQSINFSTGLNSLASSSTAGYQSDVIDNTSNLDLDALVMVKAKTSSSALANDKAVYWWVAGSADGGTTFTDGVASTGHASFTRTDPPNLVLLGALNCPSSSTVYTGGPWSVAQAFGGVMPEKWALVCVNFTGQNLDASAGGSAFYVRIQATSA